MLTLQFHIVHAALHAGLMYALVIMVCGVLAYTCVWWTASLAAEQATSRIDTLFAKVRTPLLVLCSFALPSMVLVPFFGGWTAMCGC